MCYFVYVASPLTLSEIRSMLSPGLTADLLQASDQSILKRLHPAAQTVVRLLVGACSCALVASTMAADQENESRLRRRYAERSLPRSEIIRALELHRQGTERRAQLAGSGPAALAAFVAEHARNAGVTLYYLHFGHDPPHSWATAPPPISLTMADMRARPETWLVEDRPTLVTR